MKKARDIMTANPRCVTPGDSVTDAARIMRDADVGIVPVVDDNDSMRLTGVITDRDIAIRCVAEGRDPNSRISDLMSGTPVTVRPDDDLSRVAEQMKTEQVRRIPVVEDGRLVGIIAQADIALEGNDKLVGDVVEKISEPGRR